MSKEITNNVTVDYEYTSLGEGCTGQSSCSVTSNITPGSVQAVKSTCLNKIGPDENIYYIITASFYGVGRTGVVIEDTLADSLVFNDDAEYRVNNDATATPIAPTPTGQKLSFDIGDVDANSIITLKFSVKPPEDAQPSSSECYNNTAFIKYDNGPADGIATNVITNCYSYSLLTGTKATTPEVGRCGSDIDYTITVENSGNEPVTDFKVTDDFKTLNLGVNASFKINEPTDENILIGTEAIKDVPGVTYSYDSTANVLSIEGLDILGATYDDEQGTKTNAQVLITIKGKIICS